MALQTGWSLQDSPEKTAKELCKLPLMEQLKLRRIINIKKCSSADGLCAPVRGGFLIMIRPGLKRLRAFTFGHELGHTYFFSNDEFPYHLTYGRPEGEEAWCENFAKEWLKNLSQKDKRLLTRILKENIKQQNGPIK